MKNNQSRILAERANILAKCANEPIRQLFILVDCGTVAVAEAAAAALHDTATYATGLLTAFCHVKPHLFTRIAQEESSWPIMYQLHREGRRADAQFIKALGVGTNTGINFSTTGKLFSFQTPANIVALNLYNVVLTLKSVSGRKLRRQPLLLMPSLIGLVTGQRASAALARVDDLVSWREQGPGKNLPGLSRQTAPQWANATMEIFRIVYGENFEEHPNLQKLRKSVRGHAKDANGRTGPGVVRKAMVQAVKQAWRSIAALE